VEMPKGWDTLKVYRNKANDEGKYTWMMKMDQALDLMKEMAEALEVFDNSYVIGSATAHDVLTKFKEWK
jgi:hypothetical protein